MNKRLLWIVNHKTLLQSEVPLLRELGWEVFVPKIFPPPEHWRSGATTWDHDNDLTISVTDLETLNSHNFYEGSWTPKVRRIVKSQFGAVVSAFSAFLSPLSNSARHFPGKIIARPFGLAKSGRYSEHFSTGAGKELPKLLQKCGSRFQFGQAYDSISGVEPPVLANRSRTIGLSLPDETISHTNTWRGGGEKPLFLCPDVHTAYYSKLYALIKNEFGDCPHLIMGRQITEQRDKSVLSYVSHDDLWDLYKNIPVFVYPSGEPRHVHYSPLEAMVVGAPVLYLEGALLDSLAGSRLPGACKSFPDMRKKMLALVQGDDSLRKEIVTSQKVILEQFSEDLVKEQWQSALEGQAQE